MHYQFISLWNILLFLLNFGKECSALSSINPLAIDPDEVRTVHQLIESRGYVLQEYHVLTHDGYIITVHRAVPHNFNSSTYNLHRKPVVLFHGVLTDTAAFYLTSPFSHSDNSYCGDNFGFCMLKSGRYDFWIANARGNRYSRGHVQYSDSDPRFWEFSWDHIAMGDVPAFIDLVRTVTGHQTVGYIGYSQGVSTVIAFLSMRPEYGAIIRPIISWAGACYMSHAKTVISKPLIGLYSTLRKFPGQFVLSKSFMNLLLQVPTCRIPVGNPFCGVVTQAIFGPSDHFNFTRIPTYWHYMPSSISNWQVAHFTQIALTGVYERFDYGDMSKNMAVYGEPFPPEWPIWRIPKHVPIIIMYGATDWFVDPIDSRKLVHNLRRVGVRTVIDHPIPAEKWSHLDFITGLDAGKLVYDDTLRYLDMFA